MALQAITKECQILDVLKHKNIIAVKAHGKGEGKYAQGPLAPYYYIFMELAGGGELFDQVIDRGANAMSEATGRKFMSQLLAGVHHCHARGVAHRDLKLENVLLTRDGVVKVIDFGLSHIYAKGGDGEFDRSVLLKEMCGSKSYAAPEVLAGVGYDGFLADMWSLGVCLFAMLSGFFPLDEASHADWRYQKLIDAQANGLSTVATVYSWYKRTAAHLSKEVVHLLDQLLIVEPTKRLGLPAVREHPWILERKFEAAFNPTDEVMMDDPPVFRGLGGGLGAFDGGAEMDPASYGTYEEEDMPVYRSCGSLVMDAPSAPLPGLARQRGNFNLLNGPDDFAMMGEDTV